MRNVRSLGIAVLVPVLVAAVWWLLQGPTADAPWTEPGATGEAAAPGVARSAAGVPVPGAADGQRSGDLRVAVDAPAGAVVGGGFALFGRVVASDGTPVEGAAVEGRPATNFDFGDLDPSDPDAMAERIKKLDRQRAETTTGADGTFRFAVPGDSRNVELRVRARGHVIAQRAVPRPKDADADAGTFTLDRGAIVSGRVIDRAGTPIVGASVSRAQGGQFSPFGDLVYAGGDLFRQLSRAGDDAETDAEGRFELDHVRPGEFGLRARHEDHPVARLDGLNAVAGQTLADVVVMVEPGATIRGRVVGIPEGTKGLRVLANVRRDDATRDNGGQDGVVFWGNGFDFAGASFGERVADVGADGAFELRGLNVGRVYVLQATQTGRGFSSPSACSQKLEVGSGASGVELRFEAGTTVTFRVVDDHSGTPIERLWVTDQLRGGDGGVMFFGGPEGNTRPKDYPDGQVTIANLRPKKKQTLALVVEALAHAKLERDDIELPTVGVIDLGTLRLLPAPTLRVQVTDGATGEPVAGARVAVSVVENDRQLERLRRMQQVPMQRGGPSSAVTDDDGRCELNAVADSRAVVAVRSEEHAAYLSDPLQMPKSGAAEHRAALWRGGGVEVRVVDAKGDPIAKIAVEHQAPDGARDTRGVENDGVARFEHLAPGDHQFRVARRGGGWDGASFRVAGAPTQQPAEPGWEAVAIADGARTALVLTKPPAATLTGLVRENGQPLTGASVTFVEGTGEAPAGQVFDGQLDMFGGMGGGSSRARTDADGRYSLADLQPGEHRLRVSHQSRAMTAELRVVVQLGDNVFDCDLETAILRGTVRDAKGEPVGGARIDVSVDNGDVQSSDVGLSFVMTMDGGAQIVSSSGGGRGRTRTAADGSYELRGVQPGVKLVVRARAKGLIEASSAAVEVARGATVDGVDIVMGIAGQITVQATIESPWVNAMASFAGESETKVDPVSGMLQNGTVTLDGLRPGRWTVSLQGPNLEGLQPRTVEVVAGGTVRVVF